MSISGIRPSNEEETQGEGEVPVRWGSYPVLKSQGALLACCAGRCCPAASTILEKPLLCEQLTGGERASQRVSLGQQGPASQLESLGGLES